MLYFKIKCKTLYYFSDSDVETTNIENSKPIQNKEKK